MILFSSLLLNLFHIGVLKESRDIKLS